MLTYNIDSGLYASHKLSGSNLTYGVSIDIQLFFGEPFKKRITVLYVHYNFSVIIDF